MRNRNRTSALVSGEVLLAAAVAGCLVILVPGAALAAGWKTGAAAGKLTLLLGPQLVRLAQMAVTRPEIVTPYTLADKLVRAAQNKETVLRAAQWLFGSWVRF